MLMNKTCIILVGPTASGKTALAVDLATHFNTEIISADSRQCFRELNIGVAKPNGQQLEQVRHHFINSHSIHDTVNAVVFERYAIEAVSRIFEQHDVAVMAGGTGMYIRAFCDGFDDIPEIDADIRKEIHAQYAKHGLPWLQRQVQQSDPIFYGNAEIKNPQRLMRALEVKLFTGKSIREFQEGKKAERNFNIITIGIDLPKEVLHSNIDRRVDDMVTRGLEQEARELYTLRSLNALQTVGYTEMFDYVDGRCTMEEVTVCIKRNTRQYAKRQMTWFRRDPRVHWVTSPGIVDLRGLLRSLYPSLQ